ncbi:ribosomal protein S5 domain 2-type protein [Lactarius quietus]|nr:ribosomal protein S5 domain 2-type protein [Lactarius quietus]
MHNVHPESCCQCTSKSRKRLNTYNLLRPVGDVFLQLCAGLDGFGCFRVDELHITPCDDDKFTLSCLHPRLLALPDRRNHQISTLRITSCSTQLAPCKQEASNTQNNGADIILSKRIPVGGGLSGGSANAAATLVTLNQLWDLGLSRTEPATIRGRFGADIPAMTIARSAWAEGTGEVLTPAPIACSSSSTRPSARSLAPYSRALISCGLHHASPARTTRTERQRHGTTYSPSQRHSIPPSLQLCVGSASSLLAPEAACLRDLTVQRTPGRF